MKGKKQTEAEVPLELRFGRMVPADYDLGHWSFFVYGDERKGGQRVINFPGGRWVLRTTDVHPNWTDFGIYVGVLKAFEIFERSGKVEFGRMKEGRETQTISISGNELCRWCNLEPGSINKKNAFLALMRLKGLSAVRWKFTDDGKWESVREFRLLRDVEYASKNGRQGKIEITVDAEQRLTLDRLRLLRWRDLQELPQIERALLTYISCNRSRTRTSEQSAEDQQQAPSLRLVVSQQRLLKYLGVIPPSKPAPNSKASEFLAYTEKLEAFKVRKKSVVSKIKTGLIELSKKMLIGKFAPGNVIQKRGGALYIIRKIGHLEGKILDVERDEIKRTRKAEKEAKRSQVQQVQVTVPTVPAPSVLAPGEAILDELFPL